MFLTWRFNNEQKLILYYLKWIVKIIIKLKFDDDDDSRFIVLYDRHGSAITSF